MKMDFQDRIDDYLLGRMSENERERFESDAANDSELKEQLNFTETVRQVTRSRNEKLDAMKEWKSDYTWKNNSPFKKTLYWVSGIAAIFIVGIFAFNLYSRSLLEKTTATAPRFYESSSKNSYESVGSARVDVDALLAMGEYNKALASIEEDEAHVRTDLMLLERDLHSRGEIHEDATTEKNALEMELVKLSFLKAQALIGLGKTDEARVLLDEIRHSKSDYGIKADSLYHHLLQ